MKKNLMKGVTAIALCGMITSCSHEVDLGGSSTQKTVEETYETAFTTRFGQPAATQDWGFGTSSASTRAYTRAAVASPSVTLVGQTYNSFMAESYASAMVLAQNWVNKGWRSTIDYDDSRFAVAKPWHNSNWTDRYYQITASVVESNITSELQSKYTEAVLAQVPEGVNNISKATSTGYSLTTKGGEVTVTPIYHNSNSDDKVSYYYYPAGTTPDVKSLPKYTIGQLGNEDAMLKTHSLVYVDGAGNASYTFPENYIICFVIANMSGATNNVSILTKGTGDTDERNVSYPSAPEYYADGNYNQEIHTVNGWNYTPTNTSHAAVFSTSSISFVGFEDWNDMDYNDLIFAVGGTTGGGEIEIDEPEPTPTPTDEYEEIRVIAEDLTVNDAAGETDFDFNDVVFDVRRYTSGDKTGTVEIILQAAGGTLPLYVAGEEVHKKFGVGQNCMVNTNAEGKGLNGATKDPVSFTIDNTKYSGSAIGEIAKSIKVVVTKNNEDIELKAPEGAVASKIAVGTDYEWCEERQDIDNKYSLTDGTSLFKSYVIGEIKGEWYNYVKANIDSNNIKNN